MFVHVNSDNDPIFWCLKIWPKNITSREDFFFQMEVSISTEMYSKDIWRYSSRSFRSLLWNNFKTWRYVCSAQINGIK